VLSGRKETEAEPAAGHNAKPLYALTAVMQATGRPALQELNSNLCSALAGRPHGGAPTWSGLSSRRFRVRYAHVPPTVINILRLRRFRSIFNQSYHIDGSRCAAVWRLPCHLPPDSRKLLWATSENPKLCVTLPRQNAHLP